MRVLILLSAALFLVSCANVRSVPGPTPETQTQGILVGLTPSIDNRTAPVTIEWKVSVTNAEGISRDFYGGRFRCHENDDWQRFRDDSVFSCTYEDPGDYEVEAGAITERSVLLTHDESKASAMIYSITVE